MHFLTKSKSIDVGKLLGTIILHGGVNLCSATKLFLEKVAGGQEPYTKEEEEAKFLRLDFGVYIHDSSEATLGQAGSEHRAPSAGSGRSRTGSSRWWVTLPGMSVVEGKKQSRGGIGACREGQDDRHPRADVREELRGVS